MISSQETPETQSLLQQELNFKRAIIAKTKILLAQQENELSIADNVINEHEPHTPSLIVVANHVRPEYSVDANFFSITSIKGKDTFENHYFREIAIPIFNEIQKCTLMDIERKYQQYRTNGDVNRDIDIIPFLDIKISEANEILVSAAKFIVDDLVGIGPIHEMRNEGHTRLNLGFCPLSKDDSFETKVEDLVYNIYVVYIEIEISQKALPSIEQKYSLKCEIIPQEYLKNCNILRKLV